MKNTDTRLHTTWAAAIAAFVPAPMLHAEDVTTSFEFTDLSGEFTLGRSPDTVTFLDGEAKTVGILGLYHTGMNSWMIESGQTGTIEFETPAASIDLWFRDQFGSNDGVVTVLDTNDAVVATFDGSTTWQNVKITVGKKEDPIGAMTVENNGASGYTVVDDFMFCAAQGGEPGLEDPIPASIPPSELHVILEPVATGLTAPNWGRSAPGDPERLFVTDQDGILWAVNVDGSGKSVMLDVSDRLVTLGIGGPGTFDERGLLGVAIHPDYQRNGLLYTYTSEPVAGPADFSTIPMGETANHQSVILEWQVPKPGDPGSVVDPDSARELLRIDQPQFNHDGGALDFGPDGMLYLALGDGGAGDDEGIGHGKSGNGRDPTTVLGSILRIDPQGSDAANGEYGIPADNPFAGPKAPAENVDEIFAYGFRNPFRVSFDVLTGDLYAADVGQNDIEEIDIVVSGGNYGWNHMEGSFFFDGNGMGPGFVTDQDPGVPEDLILPIAEYDHDEGIAIVGGFVYRGTRLQPLIGRYIFGEFAQTFASDGRLFHLDANDQILEFVTPRRADIGFSVLGFGQDGEGEVYLVANTTGVPFEETGVVLHITAAPGDVNLDGVVGVLDLITLILNWGDCPDPKLGCPADLNGDGMVSVQDLVILITNWTT